VAGKAKGQPLNVVFVISDDLRTELGSYAGRAQTPTLDRLAAQGVRFERAYAQYPLCNPSRSSMLTGRRPTTTNVYGNREWYGADHPGGPACRATSGTTVTTLRGGKIFHEGIDDTQAWVEGASRTASASGRPGRPPASARAERGNGARRADDAGRSRASQSDRWEAVEGEALATSNALSPTADRAAQAHAKDEAPFFSPAASRSRTAFVAPKRFFDLYDVKDIALPPTSRTPDGAGGLPRRLDPQEQRRSLHRARRRLPPRRR
jgi:arylsulfatase A-like enzyme